MKFFNNEAFFLLFFILIVSNVHTEGLRKKNKNKVKSSTTGPRDGCIMLYTKCSFTGSSIELCEDVYDFKLIKDTNWAGAYPTSVKIGKYITASIFESAKYSGKTYTASADVDCFKNTGFKNDPGSIKINHIRDFTVDKEKLQLLKQARAREDAEEIKQIDIDRKAIFLRRSVGGDLIYDEYDKINKRDLGEGRIFLQKREGEIEKVANDQIREERFEIMRNREHRQHDVSPMEEDRLMDEKFKNMMGNRIFALEQKLEKIQNERAHPSIACWESKIAKPEDTLLDKTKVIWNRTQFNKDPGNYRLSGDRTTIEIMKEGLYRIDAKIATNSGSNIQAILDINQTEQIRFHGSATTGNTQDANLGYYRDMKPLDHFSVFIATTGTGPNNVLTDPVNRVCIRKISH